jgi:hypothetical protein
MSAKPQTFFVHRFRDKWFVTSDASEQYWGPLPTRDQAMDKAKDIARERKPSVVKVRDRAGEWSEEQSAV